MAMALARAAEARGWDTVTWVPSPGPALDAVVKDGLKYRTLELEPDRTSRLPQLLTCARLYTALVRQRRTVVHVHDGWMWGLVRPALLRTGARTVVHVNIEPDEAEITWTLKRPPAHIAACARYVACQYQSAADRMGVRVAVSAVPNAVDVTRFSPGDRDDARRRIGLGHANTFVILILANLSPHKGQATALRALKLLREQGLSAECWIVGEDRGGGDYLRTLRALTAELGLAEHARFLGYRSDAEDLLRAADAFVLPTTHEGLPFSILEAQSAGVPVVASDIPGVLEVVEDNRSGFIVPADDAAGYADRLARLAHDPELRRRLTQTASEFVRREHRWQTFEDRMFALYTALADKEQAA
jgi:glycosyltransferase involved in cell wall biosynthesis